MRLRTSARFDCVVFVLLVCVIACLHASLLAQEQASAPDQSKEIAALKQQIAQLQQPTPEQLVKQAQVWYAAIFKEAKEKAQPGCKAVGGRLRVTVTPKGEANVSCEW